MRNARLLKILALIAPILGCLALVAQGSPVAGQKIPREVAALVTPQVADLRRALAIRDEMRVRRDADAIISALGEWAGIPDAAAHYRRPIERVAPDFDALLAYWRNVVTSMALQAPWLTNPGADPGKMNSGLRVVGDSVSGYAKLATLFPSERSRDTALARAGADYLLKTQRPEGFFPFPDLRGRNAQFGPMIDHLARDHPEAIANGWVINDGGSGDLKYDTAFCGVALLDAWRLTADPRYLAGAKRAAEWASVQPLVANWNYNAFSAWLLGEVAFSTRSEALLKAAEDHVFIGILPGQMTNGRWFDQHNARLVYHCIIVRGLIATWKAMPVGNPRRAELRQAIDLALANACSEIRTNGSSSASTSTEALGMALQTFGSRQEWAEAAQINVNAVLADAKERDSEGPSLAGFFMVNYLAWRLEDRSTHP